MIREPLTLSTPCCTKPLSKVTLSIQLVMSRSDMLELHINIISIALQGSYLLEASRVSIIFMLLLYQLNLLIQQSAKLCGQESAKLCGLHGCVGVLKRGWHGSKIWWFELVTWDYKMFVVGQ